MNLYDLNPGDIIRIKPAEYRVNIFRRDITKEEFEVCHLKLNDSFPEAIIQVPMIEKQKDINGKEFIVSERYIKYGVNAKEILLVEHLNRNTKRWNWIVNRIAIGDNYPTLYYSIIAGNEFARFNWQTWGDDGFYHCPFCDKELNSVHEIEDRDEKAAKKANLYCLPYGNLTGIRLFYPHNDLHQGTFSTSIISNNPNTIISFHMISKIRK